MKSQPPPLAVALLERFLPDNEPLTGDLLETSRVRSSAWFWRQVLLAVLARAFFQIQTHKRMTTEAALVSTAMLALLGFHAVVVASLINHLLVLNDTGWVPVTGEYERWQLQATVPSFVAAVAIGRVIGRFHRDHRIAAVLAFGASATLASFLNLCLFVPNVVLQPFVPYAALQTVVAMVFIAGLLIGIASGPTVRTVVMFSVLLAAGVHPPVSAQVEGQRFDVASIRRNVAGNQQGSGLAAPQPGGRYIAIGVTLRRLIGDAYGGQIVDGQIVGGPQWVDSDRFDVNAKAEGEPTSAQIRIMLRPLLAERFKLKVHTEARDMAVYTLALARSDRTLGAKLRVSDAKCAAEATNYFPGQSGFPPPCGDFRPGARALTARGMTMQGLARLLTARVGRPVLDRTGLEAAFDLELEWSSDLGLARAPRDSAGAGELTPDGLSLFTALQEQLGLRLEATRAPVDVLVIDSAEPPTPD